MLREAIDKIQTLAVAAVRPRTLADPSNPRRSLLIHNGNLSYLEHQPGPVQAHAYDIDSFVDAIQRLAKGDDTLNVWVAKSKVTARWGKYRDNELVLPLQFTQRWAWIMKHVFIEKPTQFEQADFIRVLRTLFHDVAQQPQILNGVRNVKFLKEEVHESNIQRGDDGLGQSVHRSLANADQVTQTLDVFGPVYQQLRDIEVKIQLDLDVNLAGKKFFFTYIGDCIDVAFETTQEAVKLKLSEDLDEPEDKPFVFFGEPRA